MGYLSIGKLNIPENKPKGILNQANIRGAFKRVSARQNLCVAGIGNFDERSLLNTPQESVLPSNQYGDLHVHWCGLSCVALCVEGGVISMTLVGIHLNSRLTEASHLVAQSHVIQLSGKLNTLLNHVINFFPYHTYCSFSKSLDCDWL